MPDTTPAQSVSPAGPPDPEFDWLVAPLLQLLQDAVDTPAGREAIEASESRFRQMAGRIDLSQHTRLRQDARRDVEERASIARIQKEMASLDGDLPSMMAAVVERARLLTGADAASLDLVEDGVLVCRAAVGMMAPLLGRRGNIEHSLSGLAYRERSVMICDDTEIDDRVDRAAARLVGVRSLIVAPLRSGEEMIGVLAVHYPRPNAFQDRDIGNMQILGESIGVTIDKRRVTEQLRASEAQYRLLFARNPHPMYVSELGSRRLLAVNASATEHYGYPEQELLQMRATDLLAEDDPVELERQMEETAHLHKLVDVRRRHRRKDGSVFDVEVSADTIVFNGTPARLVLCNDVTERLRAERELARVSRAQRMLSACNEILVRVTSEQALLVEVCRVTVEIGGYSMAWVGFAQDDANRTILPVASVGDAKGYLRDIDLSWCEATEIGRGPAGQTIRSGRLTVVPDIAREPSFRHWMERALAHGFRGTVCMPLRDVSRTYGLFYLYMSEVTQLGQDEVKLLESLADDLAFGIANMRVREQQRRTHEAQQRIQTAMLKVASAVSASTGTEFFEQLALNMADALGAQAGFIAVLLPDGPLRARTLGSVVHDRVRRNFDAPLEGSKVGRLLANSDWIVTEGVEEEFAPFPLLRSIGAQAYAGRRLEDAAGHTIGFVLVAFAQPLAHREFMASTLRIFAVRAAAELDRQQADERIRHQASLLDKAQDAIMVRDMQDRVLYWNKSAERLYGWSADEAMGQSVASLLYDDDAMVARAQQQLMASGEWSGEMSRQRKQGSAVLVEARWTLVRDDHGEPLSILMIDTDIGQRKAAESKIQKLAFFDALTSLPNRQLLQDRLHKALALSVRSGRGGALLCIDLDNFKTLNDTLGHDRGDMLLQQVALRLVSCVREVDTVARLGGDEFVVVLEELGTTAQEVAVQARAVGEKILAALSQPYRLEGYEHQSTASMGVARFGAESESVGELLKQADIAMYQAKGAGRHTLRFFDPGLQAAVTARAAMEADLRQAFIQREFFLQYQPQVDGMGRITGVEALVRWRNASRGLVSPAEFIPLAEETGMILLLGHRVLEIACTLLASWRGDPHTDDLTMAVNVSARQFRHVDFVRQVQSVLAKTGADPERLKLELTESVLVDDMEAIVSKMTALKEMGVRFALDDFGTGYSSLSYLKRLPLDQLKIDQSFVRDVLTDPNDAAIARTVIALAQSLGLGVIAEGVETAEQRDFLAGAGCPAFQGYLFSRPVPVETLDKLLRERTTARPISAIT